ncbi:phage portal protein [Kitasatospora purpeofusca]|uniref:phage portal protein n=1 Tax=Kitasatospora purpeofusca TaxID=67352 RepID=UPI0022517A20|nr:phage portal protein [Kitasatospora purpeofusca]MCX4686771.1 phage portal protein [Kitasatospora purpeofusca]
MPMLRALLGRRRTRTERARSLPALTSNRTAAGITVAPERALQVSAVYSCVRLLAETGSMLPASVIQRTGRARTPVPDHPAAVLLGHQANPELPSGEFWAQTIGWLGLRGNALAYIERNAGGVPVGLWPIRWTSAEMLRQDDGRLVYKVTPDEDEYAPISEPGGLVRSENMLHFRAFGTGLEGLSPIGMARQSVGIAYSATEYIGAFFARDASPGGIVSVPGKLDDTQYDRLSRQWRDLHEGVGNSHRLALMEAGAKWEHTSLSPADAQFLEVYKMSRADIAGIYGVPPHMIGDVDRSTSWGSGIEQQSLGYVIYSLMPWLTRLERTAAQLFGSDRSLSLRFNARALLRGDTAQRYAGYAQGRQWGWLSVNDIREMEDEEPITDGDTYLAPLNMQPVGGGGPAARALPARRSAETPTAEDLPAWITRHHEQIGDYFAQLGEDVAASLGVAPDADADDLIDAAAASEDLALVLVALAQDLVGQSGAAAAAAMGSTFDPGETSEYVAANAAGVAANITATTVKLLRTALTGAADKGGVRAAAAAAFDAMATTRALQLAEARVGWAANFGTHEGAKQGGARTKTWRTTGSNSRKTHRDADGQTVAIREDFKVGRRTGRWPHDARLGADENAGCTCRLVFNKED